MKHTARAVSGLLRAYQRFVSPWLGARCRFHPSCSAYTLEAVQRHGAGRGLVLGMRRLARCHPWSAGGFDAVPGDDQRMSRRDDRTERRNESLSETKVVR